MRVYGGVAAYGSGFLGFARDDERGRPLWEDTPALGGRSCLAVILSGAKWSRRIRARGGSAKGARTTR